MERELTTATSPARRPIASLDYAPASSGRRRWVRRARRWWPIAALAVAVAIGVIGGPRVWRRYQILKLQDACLAADLGNDVPIDVAGREGEAPVATDNNVTAYDLAAARPTEYRADGWGHGARVDSRWAAFRSVSGFAGNPHRLNEWIGTAFLHERRTPSGRRRLVVVEEFFVTVIEPAGWFGDARVVRQERLDFRAPDGSDAFLMLLITDTLFEHYAGSADPNDGSRFTLRVNLFGLRTTWEARLGDDDRVTLRLLDPEALLAARKRWEDDERARLERERRPGRP